MMYRTRCARWPIHAPLGIAAEVVRSPRYADLDVTGDGVSVEARSTFTKGFLPVR